MAQPAKITLDLPTLDTTTEVRYVWNSKTGWKAKSLSFEEAIKDLPESNQIPEL